MTVVMEVKGPQPNFVFSPNALLGSTSGTPAVEQSKAFAEPVHHIQLKLTNVRIDIADANAYGGTLLGYVPDENMICHGGEMNLTWSKDGAGIVTGENPKLALGTAAASNATLSSTMSNLINGGATGGTAIGTGLTGTWQYHSNDNASAPPAVWMNDGATTGIYLNSSVNPTGDGYLLFSGTIDLYFTRLGNTTS